MLTNFLNRIAYRYFPFLFNSEAIVEDDLRREEYWDNYCNANPEAGECKCYDV